MATTKVFVGSLPPGTKPEELRYLFENYGIVVECDVMNRCGFVHMETKEMACTAITALNATQFKGQMIVVELGRPKDKKPGGGGAADSVQGGRGGTMGGGRGRGRGGPQHGGRVVGPGDRNGDILGVDRHSFGNAASRSGSKNNFGQGGGPMRIDQFKQQRNVPYQRRNGPDGPGGAGGGKFGGAPRGNFNSGGGAPRGYGRSGGDMAQQNFNNWDGQSMEGNGNFGGGNNFNDDSFGGGFGGNMTGGPRGNFGGNNGVGGQDRRGFALPTDARAGNQRFSGGNHDRGAFGGGGGSHNTCEGLFSRRNNGPNTDMGGRGGNRGAFGGGRGGFGGRGASQQNVGGRGGFTRRGGEGDAFGAQINYNSEFPPLGTAGGGGRGGGMQRNGPRQNMMPNQRY